MYIIIKEKCVDCGNCAFLCPFGAIIHHVEEQYYEIDQEKCKQCDQCYIGCVNNAIEKSSDQKVIKTIIIDPARCIGCSICARNCPTQAISGEMRSPFLIHDDKCIKCGVCATKCPKKAIDITYK